MKKIALMMIGLALLVPAHAGTERLIGTWKSNKAATLDYLKTHTKLTPQQLEKLGTILGQMTCTFDSQSVTFKSGDWKFVSQYKIVEETKTVIVIEAENPETKKLETTRLDVDAKGFWTPEPKIPGYKERFDKVSK